MCSNKELFDTYDKEEGGEVMMGDGSMCRVKGTDTIKVKMHDRAVRTLEMVRRIPKLRKNLISLETLDKNVTGGAAVSTSKDSDDETQLWHLRLGHMSERGMQELHNRKLLKDVWGSSPVKSNEKSEIFTKFKEWKAEVENLTGRKIKILKSDNGAEYKDNKFLRVLQK
ncbi:PREDICTED: Retrovirus-related Pol poly from transposon [Prunus dulcis]|uniref:PREDICTED: Retrovirus-related Pol poly from transposon n=1 Tax=Prunus dulcis TaxID=3755 RepID=A0A5E4FAM7_PRUDU|nr:PREDICTED: Retrovirus-related Pol poly from transposon [Prunus dulcis]